MRHKKVSSEGERRGFTSKRCSGEFNFVITGKDLQTRSNSRLEQKDNRKESSGKDTTWKKREGMKVFRPEDGDSLLDNKRFWLEQRSLTVLDERIFMDPSVSKDAEVIRGQMWVQKSSLFSQWKERHLVLRGRVLEVHRLEGGLLNLIGLSDVEKLEMEEKQG